MSSELLHELFSGLEKTVHERLAMAEDVLHKKQESELAELVRVQGYKIDALSLQLNRISEQLAQMKTPAALLPSAMTTMMTATPALAPAPAPAPIKNIMISPPQLPLPEPEVVEQEVDDAEAEVEEEEVEEEEEEEGESVEPFTYKGKTYYKDSENQVYQVGSDGELDDTPIGMWNEKTKRITPI
jgi:hypothetical protein